MASPFPTAAAAVAERKIRAGSELVNFRTEHADGKILPKKGEKNVLITSALPYVNNQPHLGQPRAPPPPPPFPSTPPHPSPHLTLPQHSPPLSHA
ncbi:hypothetical protein RQP46_001847 [Phenoliferia psychrophenolica]